MGYLSFFTGTAAASPWLDADAVTRTLELASSLLLYTDYCMDLKPSFLP